MAWNFNKFWSARRWRSSPRPSPAPRFRNRRRGTVLVMVVGVLAMLFIIGATQLLVARFERDAAQQKRAADNLQGVATAMSLPAMAQLRQDVVGNDGVPYNADNQTYTVDNPPIEDYADFSGVAGNTLRSGDLLLSSLEPYLADPFNKVFKWFAVSWAMDAAPDWMKALGQNPPPNNSYVPLPSSPVNGGGTLGDADADGMLDSIPLGVGLSGPFGGTYRLFQKIVPHSGMVLMDRMTHPALLAQVIHPSDGSYHSQPWQLFQSWVRTDDDESRLRRRGMLPGSVTPGTNDWQALASSDLRTLLPFTLGYRSSVSAWSSVTPHWWPVDPGVKNDVQWWQARMTPGPGLTENYSANQDMYDRQHLITTASNDDLLRRQRNEKGVDFFGDPLQTDPNLLPLRPFYYVVAPTAAAGTDAAGINTQPANAYGISPYTGAMEFNKPGLRTPFSLRDVLVNAATNPAYDSGGATPLGYGVQASYRRAIQLTAYYLAMLQHTQVPVGDRLLTAMQLAVNTIDFADNADLDNNGSVAGIELDKDYITRLVLNVGGVNLTVHGIEKQPFITEAYARIVQNAKESVADSGVYDTWEPIPDPADCTYAVELYNPYDTDLPVGDYLLKTTASTVDLGAVVPSGIIPARSYIVIANQNPRVGTDGVDVFPTGTGTGGTALVIPTQDAVKLVRKTVLEFSDSSPLPKVIANPAGELIVDQIMPTGDLGNADGMWARPRWVASENSHSDPMLPNYVRKPVDGNDKLCRDSSLQRRKDLVADPLAPYTYLPIHWQFTLGRQIQFPLAWNENHVDNTTGNTVSGGWLLEDTVDRPVQHNLLGTALWANPNPVKGMGPVSNQQIVAAEFDGREVIIQPGGSSLPVAVFPYRELPVASFPVLVSDRGLDKVSLTGGLVGAAAFPTTGSLLLVTRDGHTSFNGKPTTVPLTVSAGQDLAAAQNVNNGHMPVFNGQATLDQNIDGSGNAIGRLAVPWGQLVFDYFTALPLEELTTPLFLGAADQDTYENNYVLAYGDSTGGAGHSLYPLVDRVTLASSPFAPSVRGRININFAPWWVLDGLPVLPDAEPRTSSPVRFAKTSAIPVSSDGPAAGVPLPELLSGRLDPVGLSTNPIVGKSLMDLVMMDDTAAYAGATAGYPTIGPEWARYIVSYRENRPVVRADGTWVNAANGGDPGFVTVGSLCQLMPLIQIPAVFNGSAITPMTFELLRKLPDPSVVGSGSDPAAAKPFSYVGYLQMIAPIVRLQDWATVKGHVFTIYSVIGDTGNPPVWLRSQTTVDRTRCLYTNDLPDRILQTDVLGFYNAVTDQ